MEIAAACVGFLTALDEVGNRLREISRKLQDSHTVRATLELGQQLTQLEYITRSLQDRGLAPSPDVSWGASFDNVVKQIILSINSCHAVLDDILKLVEKLDTSLKEKARWVFKNHEKAMALCENLNTHYNCLDLALNTILVLTTHRTLVIADQNLYETVQVNEHVRLTRQTTEDIKDDTTFLKDEVQQVGQGVDQMGYDVSEMLALLRKFDHQRSWPYEGHGGFITTDLCYSLERYIQDESGIDPDELRTQFSGPHIEDDLASHGSGWTWNRAKQGARVGGSISALQAQFAVPATLDSTIAGARLESYEASRAIPLDEMGESNGSGAMKREPGDMSQRKADALDTLGRPLELGVNADSHLRSARHVSGSSVPVSDEVLPRLASSASPTLTSDTSLSVSDLNAQPQEANSATLGTRSLAVTDFRKGLLSLRENTSNDGENLHEQLQTIGETFHDILQTIVSELHIHKAQNARQKLSRLRQRELFQELYQAIRTESTPSGYISHLLESGANPNLPPGQIARFQQSRDSKLEYAPPLYLAIKANNLEHAKVLLRYGADPDCQLIEKTPLEELVMSANTSHLEATASMALLLINNGAKIKSSTLSLAMTVTSNTQSNIMLLTQLLLATDVAVFERVNLLELLKAKSQAWTLDELWVEVLIQLGTEPNCDHVLAAIPLQNSRIVELLIDRLPLFTNLQPCFDAALNSWNIRAIECLIDRGGNPPPHAISRAIERNSPRLFTKFFHSTQSLPDCQVLLHKAFQHWNGSDISIVEQLISTGVYPTGHDIDFVIKHQSLSMMELVLDSGTYPSDTQFQRAAPELACAILRTCGDHISGTTKETRLQDVVRSIPPSSITGSIGLDGNGISPRDIALQLIQLLIQQGTTPTDNLLEEVLGNRDLDAELASQLLSRSKKISERLCLELVKRGQVDRLEFILGLGISKFPTAVLLEKALEMVMNCQDTKSNQRFLADFKGASLLLFNHWLKAAPTPLAPRSLQFLDNTMSEETQHQVIGRCKHHPTPATVHFLLQYSRVTKRSGLLMNALTTCKNILDNEALTQIDKSVTWVNLLVACLTLHTETACDIPGFLETKEQCVELILNHMEEAGIDINENLPAEYWSPFNLVFSHSSKEEHIMLVKLICKYGAKLNHSPVGHPTQLPLIIAAKHCHQESIKLIVDLGGDMQTALRVAITSSNLKALKELVMQPTATEIISRDHLTQLKDRDMALTNAAIQIADPDALTLLFDAGLQYDIDEDLELLGRIAENYNEYNESMGGSGPWSRHSTQFAAWGQTWNLIRPAKPATRGNLPGLFGKTQRPAMQRDDHPAFNRSITSGVLQLAVDEKFATLSVFLKRGKNINKPRHPTTEFLLTKAISDPSTLELLIKKNIPFTHVTWYQLEIGNQVGIARYLWEACPDQVTALVDGSVNSYLRLIEQGTIRSQVSQVKTFGARLEFLAFLFEVTNSIELAAKAIRVYNTIILEVLNHSNRVLALSSLFKAVSRLDKASLPKLQYFALCDSETTNHRDISCHHDVVAATIQAGIDKDYAALLYAAGSCDWEEVELIMQNGDHDLGAVLSWDRSYSVNGARASLGCSVSDRSYFCQCVTYISCYQRLDRSYPVNSVMFHAVKDGVLSVVEKAVSDCKVSLNEVYGEHWPYERSRPYKDSKKGWVSLPGLSSSSKSIIDEDLTDEDLLRRATLLHLAVFYCVWTFKPTGVNPPLESRLKILALLVQNGARVDTKVWVPSHFLKGSPYNRPTSASASRRVSPPRRESTLLSVDEFAKAIYIPDSHQTSRTIEVLGIQWKTSNLRDRICEVLKGGTAL